MPFNIRSVLLLGMILFLVALPLLGACGKEVAKEVVREVPVEKEVIKEVVREVPVEKVVTKEVPKEIVVEVPVERQVVKEVVREVPVEKVVTKEVIKEVPVEKVVTKEVIKEVPPPPTPEGKLVISMVYREFTPDPMFSTNNAKPFMELIFDFLIGKTRDAKLSTETGIANKWEVSADQRTVTFFLRKGIKFHNGDELTAEDVKFSLERAISKEATSKEAAALRARISTVEAVDPYKVVVHTKLPASDLLLYLSAVMGCEGAIVPKKYIEQKGVDYFLEHPIGTGPYRAKEIVVDSHMKLEAVDKHWRVGVPKYKTIWLKHVTEDSTRIAQLKTGEADIVEVSRERIEELRKAGYNVFTKPDSAVVVLNFYETWDPDSPLADVRVREALIRGINSKELCETLFVGLAEPHSIVLAPPDPAYDAALFPPIPYDPERAKNLIKSWVADTGRTAKIKYYAYESSGLPEVMPLAEAIAGYWAKIGVETKIVPMDYASFRSDWTKGSKDKKPAVGGGGWGAVAAKDISSRIWNFATDERLAHSGETRFQFSSPEVDAMIDTIKTEGDWDKKVELVRKFYQWCYENFVIRPGILSLNSSFVTIPEIQRWEFTQDECSTGFESLFTRE